MASYDNPELREGLEPKLSASVSSGFRKWLLKDCINQSSADSIPDSVRNFRKTLSVVSLSGRTRARQSCPDFRCLCPPKSGINRVILNFDVLKTVLSNDKFTQDPIKKQLSFGQEQSSFIFRFNIQFCVKQDFFQFSFC